MDQELSPCIVEHFIDIITITICDVICNADTWEDIEEFGKAKEGRFRKYLQLANGISSPDTIRRVFIRLKPEQLQSSFLSWVQALRHTETGAELTAIDGKTARRSFEQHGQAGDPYGERLGEQESAFSDGGTRSLLGPGQSAVGLRR
jgi:hypothetical protein